MGKARVIRRFMAFTLVLSLSLSCGPALAVEQKYMSSRYTGYYEPSTPNQMFRITSDFVKVAENGNLALFLKEKTLAVRILNKKTGYIWSSNLDQYKNERLNRQWSSYFESGLTIEYYTLNPKTQDYVIEQEGIQTDERTKVDLSKDSGGFAASVAFGKSGILLSYEVRLTESGIAVSMDGGKIIEEKDEIQDNSTVVPSPRIVSVSFYPAFGCTKAGGQKGYFFIPDGDGALVSFEKPYPGINSGFFKRYYDPDIGVSGFVQTGPFMNPSKRLNFPLYGIIHGVEHDGIMTRIIDGEENAELQMYPAGVRTDFFFITNKFLLRQTYEHFVNTTKSSMVMPKEMDRYRIKEEFILLSGEEANYTGIAKKYRGSLLDQGILGRDQLNENGIPLHLNVLMSSAKAGLFFNNTIPMTTVSQLGDILRDLKSQGVNRIVAETSGLFKDSVTVKGGDRIRINGSLGTINQFKALEEQAVKDGYEIAPAVDYWAFPYNRYAGISLEKDMIKLKDERFISFNDQTGLKQVKTYLLNPSGFKKMLASDYPKLRNIGVGSLLLGLPALASSYGENILSREASGMGISGILSSLKNDIGSLYIYGYDIGEYSFPYVKGIFGVETATSLYPYITDTVPFTSLVCLGSLELYGQTLNTSGDPEGDTLRMVEWGVYPSFDVTYEDTTKLLYSDNWWVVSSQYGDWRGEILKTYKYVNDALKDVAGQEMVAHQVIEPGLVRTVYGNGVKIIINYLDSDRVVDGVTVRGKGYRVIR